ncbi:MAG: 1-deoxy-D-xylulose-5-phosphate reductoisomerase [Selenomonadaceae bacterium]|nr:1-deoxy-D-xylulose-5-phosphate reductoisomerase [Selenomonadaceae bacterium]MBQ3725502.1 1-deoxy-D-xylulose-5-phosphate reductoisomerase [Selenomonadaceae bacterium]
MKKIAILGSTGSIGTQALDVVRNLPEEFSVEVLAANSNVELFARQVEEFRPKLAVLADEAAYKKFSAKKFSGVELAGGRQAFIDAAAFDGVEIVLTSMSGFAGLEPTIKAINAGKNIALANKETLVVAGELITKLAQERGVKILPVDSEHGAFFQCLQGEDSCAIKKLLLTASGGPFRGKSFDDLQSVTVNEVLAHPTWNMGKKITVDSATLVNKGLEVIEAKFLYGVDYSQIQVVVHPQSIVHSMVEFCDGSIIAQLAVPDMRLPIQYALTYPRRLPSPIKPLDFWTLSSLTFEKPDAETFRGLKFAYEAGRVGGTLPCAFNAANEVAVNAFLRGRIKFLQIYEVIEEVMTRRKVLSNPTLEDLIAEDKSARALATKFIEEDLI